MLITVIDGPAKGAECKLPRDGELLMGRSTACDMPVSDGKASRQHARLHIEGDKYLLTDLDSNNGTMVNGEKIVLPTEIKPGDRITIGESVLILQEDASDILIGESLGGYKLERRIGTGGMGDVYLATQVSLGRKVAVKVLSPDFAKDQSFVGKFLEEARAAGKLSHENIVHVHDVGQDRGRYYFAMEYVSGGSLQQFVEDGDTIDPSKAVELMIEAAKALQYAETERIVHCDIKPENIMLTSDGHVRLADLGIAKKTGELSTSEDGKGVFGSPHYMSPEQAKGEKVDHRSDLYSLGCTFYRLLGGRFPFDGKDGREIMEKHVYGKALPLRRVKDSVPGTLSVVIMKLIERETADRYQSANALIKDLENVKTLIAGKSGPLTQRVTRHQTRVSPRKLSTDKIIMLVGIIVVVSVASLVMYVNSLGHAARIRDAAIELEEGERYEDALAMYKEALAQARPDLAAVLSEDIDRVNRKLANRKFFADLDNEIKAQERNAAAGGEALVQAIGWLEKVAHYNPMSRERIDPVVGQLTKRLHDEAALDFRNRSAQARSLVSGRERRYGEAIAHLEKFPPYYAGTPSAREIQPAIDTIRKQARSDFEAAIASAQETFSAYEIRKSALEDALRIVRPFEENAGITEIISAAETLRRTLEQKAKESDLRAERESQEKLASEAEWQFSLHDAYVKTYRFADARTALRTAQSTFQRLGNQRRDQEFEERMLQINRMDVLFENLLAYVQKRGVVPVEFTLPGEGVSRVVGLRRATGEIMLRTDNTRELVVTYGMLPPQVYIKLMLKMIEDDRMLPDDRVALAEFALEFGRVEIAREQVVFFNRARRAMRPVAAALEEKLKAAPADFDVSESAAGVLAALAMKSAEAGDAQEARKALKILRYRFSNAAAAAGFEAEEAERILGGL